MPATPLDILAEELGAIAGRIEREAGLRIAAAVADLRRIDAERELRLVNLERAVADRMATVKDGEPGASVTLDDVRPMISEIVDKAVAAVPLLRDLDTEMMPDGKTVLFKFKRSDDTDEVHELVFSVRDGVDGASVTLDDLAPLVTSEVERAVAALPAPEKGDKGDPGEPGAAGASVTLDDLAPLVTSEVERAVAALPAPEKGEKGEPGEPGEPGGDGASVTLDDLAPLVTSEVERAVAALPVAEKGEKGDPGEPGAPGMLPVVNAWSDGVHYEGQVRAHQGATWQALRDTAKEPPHEDWICLAAGGRDGRSPRVRETFDAQADDYRELDIVALGGAAFIARKDNPGPCPGAGWQVISTQGKTGKPGERGTVGPRGEAGPAIIQMGIDGQGLLTLANADGSTVECDLYPVLAKLQG